MKGRGAPEGWSKHASARFRVHGQRISQALPIFAAACLPVAEEHDSISQWPTAPFLGEPQNWPMRIRRRSFNLQLQSGDQPGVIDAVVEVADEEDVGRPVLYSDKLRIRIPRAALTSTGGVSEFSNPGRSPTTSFSLQYTTSIEDPSKISVYWGAGYHNPACIARPTRLISMAATPPSNNRGRLSAGLLDL